MRLDVEEAELGSGLTGSLVVSGGGVLVRTYRVIENEEKVLTDHQAWTTDPQFQLKLWHTENALPNYLHFLYII